MNLQDLVTKTIQKTLSKLRVAMPATVQKVDLRKSLVEVQIVQPEMINGEEVRQPIISDVPILFLQAGGAKITFPIERGDQGLLIFCDRDISAWIDNGSPRVESNRTHAMTDAIFIPGLKGGGYETARNEAKISYRNTDITIKRNGDVDVKSPNVTMTGNLTVEGNLEVSKNVDVIGNIDAEGNIDSGSSISAATEVSAGMGPLAITLTGHWHPTAIGPTSPPQPGLPPPPDLGISVSSEGMVVEGDLELDGDISCEDIDCDSLSASGSVSGLGVTDTTTNNTLSTHIHATGAGPSSPPTPGT